MSSGPRIDVRDMASVDSDVDMRTPTFVLSSQSGPSTNSLQHHIASSQSHSDQPTTSIPANSALIFHPGPGSEPDVSPNTSTLPRAVEPLKIPQPHLTSNEIKSTIESPSTSTTTSSAGGRRGSLAAWKIPHFGEASKNKLNSNSNSNIGGNRSNPTTPSRETQNPINMQMRPTSSKGKEVIEMTSVPITDGVIGNVGLKQTGDLVIEKSKEDLAMAKWRKWVVEQPIQTVSRDVSPIRSACGSPVNGIPMVPLGMSSVSPRMSSLSSPRTNVSPRQAFGGAPLEPTGSAESSHSASGRSSAYPHTPKSLRNGSGEYEVFNTESVMALRDVELAVDEEVLERNGNAKLATRRMSTQPRISELPNPFADLAQRLGSRRVRPIVLELIQALGHYLDVVWCITYPNRSCPWIIGVNESPVPASIRRMALAHGNDPSCQMIWKSPMITAVQEGKKKGHVTQHPTAKDVRFWGDEVTFAIRDVDEVVGIYKGAGWAFGAAMRDGEYGAVSPDNVLGFKGEGGGMARLLNDLEEAIWGDAQPRPTDLSYDLPIDFDPYAILDDQEMLLASSVPGRGVSGSGAGGIGRSGSALTDFFGESRITTTSSSNSGSTSNVLPIMEEEIDALPDLIGNDADQYNIHQDQDNVSISENEKIRSPNLPSSSSSSRPEITRAKSSTITIPGLGEIPNSEELSLEEIGKRRHQEWLQSQRSHANAW
ncbi:uncharacterized protein IL334_001943 [Kwoniella shivajii]|uniref:Uncharacterized protein n=1 Tax=Kwoniella shivajii TaxID=564305 RepID=A0ABZ1CTA5_9TREE|nr:hypothetical protein IL334_001943 [Kwoniella shivajii]